MEAERRVETTVRDGWETKQAENKVVEMMVVRSNQILHVL
jgi:hypothetical protein